MGDKFGRTILYSSRIAGSFACSRGWLKRNFGESTYKAFPYPDDFYYGTSAIDCFMLVKEVELAVDTFISFIIKIA